DGPAYNSDRDALVALSEEVGHAAGIEIGRRLGCAGFLSVRDHGGSWAVAAMAILAGPSGGRRRSGGGARPIAAEGPKTSEEAKRIEVFSKAKVSVVNVSSARLIRNRFSLDIQQVPKGTGTGFI